MIELILGGARSGKSAFAEQLAVESGRPVTYIATARPEDQEMRERIEHHRRQRVSDWSVVEEPLALADALRAHAADERCLLVDCLTVWLSNLLAVESRLAAERTALLDFLPELPGHVILVSNEVGWGLVPMHPVGRRFRDEAGRLNQQLAALCERVTLVAAGLPLILKGTPA